MKRPQYVFRPNLNEPQHRRAWALLQQVPPAKRKEFLVQSIKPDYYGEYLMYKATCENRPKVLESAKRILVAIDVNFDVFGMRKEKETTDRAEHV